MIYNAANRSIQVACSADLRYNNIVMRNDSPKYGDVSKWS